MSKIREKCKYLWVIFLFVFFSGCAKNVWVWESSTVLGDHGNIVYVNKKGERMIILYDPSTGIYKDKIIIPPPWVSKGEKYKPIKLKGEDE